MKRLIIITLTLLIGCCCAFAQDSTAVVQQDLEKYTPIERLIRGQLEISTRDSLFIEYIQRITRQTEKPTYKIYPTENIYTLIKLNTVTGQLWQVQYEMNDKSTAMVVPIDDTYADLVDTFYLRAGRFELYPTKNMYTFILLDTFWGYTYQVQWSTKPENRFRMRIY